MGGRCSGVNQTSFIHSTNTLWTLTKGPALDRCCGYILMGEEHKYKHIRKCGILTRTTELQHGLMWDTWMQLISLAPVSLLASAAGTAKPQNYTSQNSLQLGLRDKLVALNPYDCWNREKKAEVRLGLLSTALGYFLLASRVLFCSQQPHGESGQGQRAGTIPPSVFQYTALASSLGNRTVDIISLPRDDVSRGSSGTASSSSESPWTDKGCPIPPLWQGRQEPHGLGQGGRSVTRSCGHCREARGGKNGRPAERPCGQHCHPSCLRHVPGFPVHGRPMDLVGCGWATPCGHTVGLY